MKELYSQTLVLLGLIVLIGCSLIATFTVDINVFCLVFIIMYSFSYSLMHNVPIYCSWEYFPKKKGFYIKKGRINFLFISTYFLGAFFFNFFIFNISNTNNQQPSVEIIEGNRIVYYFDECVYEQVGRALKLQTGFYFLLGFSAFSWIKLPVGNLFLIKIHVDQIMLLQIHSV